MKFLRWFNYSVIFDNSHYISIYIISKQIIYQSLPREPHSVFAKSIFTPVFVGKVTASATGPLDTELEQGYTFC